MINTRVVRKIEILPEMSSCFCCKPINLSPVKFGISRGKVELMTKRKVGVGAGRVRASKLESFGSPNFAERMERAWLISQQPRPVACSTCNSEGHVECKWCSGTGFFIIGDNMLCQVPSRNTTCVVCSGKGSACCSDCKGTGYRAKWLGEPPVSK